MSRLVGLILGAGLALGLALPAHAQNARTWISGTGVDQGGCGPIANPCRTLQYAHDNTSPGGEIDVKDSAGYGSVVITKAISIIGDGSLAGVLAPASGNAIEINAGARDAVVLRGLTIEGAGTGRYGILSNNVGALEIVNCTVQNFQADGNASGIRIIQDSPAKLTVQILNTTASNNTNVGFYFHIRRVASPKVNIAVNDSVASRNGVGLAVFANPAVGDGAVVNISNSLFDFNGIGVDIVGKSFTTVDLSRSQSNRSAGFSVQNAGDADTGGALVIGRSVSANNSVGVRNNNGTIQSYGNNQIVGNGTATAGTIDAIAPM